MTIGFHMEILQSSGPENSLNPPLSDAFQSNLTQHKCPCNKGFRQISGCWRSLFQRRIRNCIETTSRGIPKALFLGRFEGNRGRIQADNLVSGVPKKPSAGCRGRRRQVIWLRVPTRNLRILDVACAQQTGAHAM